MPKRKFEWPEHTTWWDRNEKKMNIVLWSILFTLLIIAREFTIRNLVYLEIATVWSVFFFVNLFLLSFVTRR